MRSNVLCCVLLRCVFCCVVLCLCCVGSVALCFVLCCVVLFAWIKSLLIFNYCLMANHERCKYIKHLTSINRISENLIFFNLLRAC